MKQFKDFAAQGDVFIRRIDCIPKTAVGVSESKEEPGKYIIAHSETGHHHVIDRKNTKFYTDSTNPMVAYLEVLEKHADLVHLRDFDTHEALRFNPGKYEVRRQREWVPEGWRRVED
jgi:hypothetical protein